MNHFLARLGRSKFATYLMPAATTIGTGALMAYHSLGHNLVEKLFGSSNPDGSPMKICDHLRNLITEVYDESLKHGWHNDYIKNQLKTFTFPDPPVRWFASATIDPFVVGTAQFASGVSIALPSHYNYQKALDLPDNLFEVRQVSLFKTLRLTDQQKEEKEQERLIKEAEIVLDTSKNLTRTVFKIDKNSPEGREYIDSLLLSDDAKRYSLAKELFLADSYKALANILLFTMSMILTHSLARSYVRIFKLEHAHVTQRLPGYLASGIFGYGFLGATNASTSTMFENLAHKKVMAMGERYRAGCREYNKKLLTRNKILRIKYHYLYEPTQEVSEP